MGSDPVLLLFLKLGADGPMEAMLRAAQQAVALDTLESAAPNLVESRALGDSVWEPGQWDAYMLHNLIRRVRRKMEESLGDSPDLIVTVPGVGYRLV